MADDSIIDDYILSEEEEEPETQPEKPLALAPEPLLAALIRDVVERLWPDDRVMADLVDYVIGPLSDQLGHVGAKGGEFVAQREQEGLTVQQRYTRDQSQRAHVLNGLLPALHVARCLQAWGAPQLRPYDETTRRLFIAGYVLHDYLKLPGMGAELARVGLAPTQAPRADQVAALEAVVDEWCTRLGLTEFLEPLGEAGAYLHDLIYLACNTQTRWGTLRNLSALPRLRADPVQLDLAEQLSRLADLLAYVARTPPDVASNSAIQRELATLSNRAARLTYHHVAENRGVLTNFIHNAALAAMAHEFRVPLLYAPSGVVYLELKGAAPPPPPVADVAQAAVARIQAVVGRALRQTRRGFQRDGKGLKYADYYWLFFDLASFILLGAEAVFDQVREGKKPCAGKRFAKMRDEAWLDPSVDLDLPDDLRVDQLAEWCYLAERQVAARLPGFDTAGVVLRVLGLEDIEPTFGAVPRDNRAGGVGYHWYLVAGHYLKRHPGLDPAAWRGRIEQAARDLARAVSAAAQPSPPQPQGDWQEVESYIERVLTLGPASTGAADRSAFVAEAQRYEGAKRRGRGRSQVCSLCSSPYRVDKQREAAVLFAPQVYSNKRPLHSTDAIREICSLCSMEMMLRQILMNRSAASGGRFEGRRVRYLYFYPTYFFTPETLQVLRRAYVGLRTLSFAELRRQLVAQTGEVDLSPATLQRLEPLLLTPADQRDEARDRYLRLHFPEEEPVTSLFVGLPAPRDAKEAEAWVQPAFLALLLPLCLDVKVVASESPMPLMLEADDLSETVFLDAPHAAIGYLTQGQPRVNIDRVLPTLQRLTVGYLINFDANSRMGRTGFDYRWQDLPGVARALSESPLQAFHFLKKWQRKQERDSIPEAKARQYLAYASYLSNGGMDMSHARELALRYRRFYRARRYNSNSILRPLSIAARAILEADSRLFDQAGLVEAVVGELRSFSERAQREGLAFFPRGSTHESREAAMRDFAGYMVNEVFFKALRGDRSALRGRQLNLLKSACEVVYRDESARDRSERELVEDATSTAEADSPTTEEEEA